jgi:hypothetical protein
MLRSGQCCHKRSGKNHYKIVEYSVMEITNKAPKVPISQFKRTKIIATLGPPTNNYQSVLAMMQAGANGFRLNFSHGTHEERIPQIE